MRRANTQRSRCATDHSHRKSTKSMYKYTVNYVISNFVNKNQHDIIKFICSLLYILDCD